jgi:cytochrome c
VSIEATIYALCLALLGPATALATGTSNPAPAGNETAAMVELAWRKGCFNCHDLDQTVRGPAWRDVAQRYRDQPEALSFLRERVRDGSSGNWGDDQMSPNRRVSMQDIDQLVNWLLRLEPAADSATRR